MSATEARAWALYYQTKRDKWEDYAAAIRLEIRNAVVNVVTALGGTGLELYNKLEPGYLDYTKKEMEVLPDEDEMIEVNGRWFTPEEHKQMLLAKAAFGTAAAIQPSPEK